MMVIIFIYFILTPPVVTWPWFSKVMILLPGLQIFVRERLAFHHQHDAIFSGYKGIIHRIIMCDKMTPRPFGKDRIARSAGLKLDRTRSLRLLRQNGQSAKLNIAIIMARPSRLTESIVVRVLSLALLAGIMSLHLQQTCQLSTKAYCLTFTTIFSCHKALILKFVFCRSASLVTMNQQMLPTCSYSSIPSKKEWCNYLAACWLVVV